MQCEFFFSGVPGMLFSLTTRIDWMSSSSSLDSTFLSTVCSSFFDSTDVPTRFDGILQSSFAHMRWTFVLCVEQIVHNQVAILKRDSLSLQRLWARVADFASERFSRISQKSGSHAE